MKQAGSILVFALAGLAIPPGIPAQAAGPPLPFTATAAGGTSADSDFNGDGYADLAIGAPYEDLSDNDIKDAGTVHVLYSSPTAPQVLSAVGNKGWTQDSNGIQGTAEDGDRFGAALASGDFDDDGYDDLAIGIPGEDLEGTSDENAGAVAVLYGSSSGLTATGDQLWTQDSTGIEDQSEDHDGFGSALAAGDFNEPLTFCIEPGADDLAIGVPNENLSGSKTDAGAVHVLYSSPTGLDDCANQFWTQDSDNMPNEAEAGDHFGASLATGMWGSGAGLAIGVPDEDIGDVADAGGVAILDPWYGLAAGDFWHQDKGDVMDQAEAGDHFGYALAATDFYQVICCGEGTDDLAIGVYGEDSDTADDTGVVHILPGDDADDVGLMDFGQTYLTMGVEQAGAKFGHSLAAGPLGAGSGDHYLAMGAPYYDVSGLSNAGMVVLEYFGGGTDAEWTQDSANISDEAEGEDRFGWSVRGAVTSGTYTVMLAIGVPREDIDSVSNAGAAAVLYGGTSGFDDADNQFWSQNSAEIANTSESGDRMGESVG